MEQNNAYALIGLGHLHYDFKEYKDALYYWTRMFEINRDKLDIRILTSIGNCHRKLKTFDKGVYYFERALEMDPKNFYALFGLADCYRGMNQQYRKSHPFPHRQKANEGIPLFPLKCDNSPQLSVWFYYAPIHQAFSFQDKRKPLPPFY